MPDPKDFKKTGFPKSRFDKIAEARLKSAICKTLNTPNLPTLFHFHNLDALLFFSRLKSKMEHQSSKMYLNFQELYALWKNGLLRYEDPNNPFFTLATCEHVERWLDDAQEGLVTWLKGHG